MRDHYPLSEHELLSQLDTPEFRQMLASHQALEDAANRKALRGQLHAYLARVLAAQETVRPAPKTEGALPPPLPCPHCGQLRSLEVVDNIEANVLTDVKDLYAFTVRCNASPRFGGCGAMSGLYGSPAEALEAWNRRPPRVVVSHEAAYEMGYHGTPHTDYERGLFEAYMRGHCWHIGPWCDKNNSYVEMSPRILYAVWRARGALETPATPTLENSTPAGDSRAITPEK